MTDPTLRDYRPDSGDLQAMHALDLVCFTEPFRFTRRAMRRFAEAPNAITLLAETGTQLAAFCIAHLEPDHPAALHPEPPDGATQTSAPVTAYIVTLDVAPPYRRQGLARRLMHQIDLRAQAAGANTIALHVFPGNAAACHLYESLGFHPTALAPNFYGPAHDALIYRKPIAASLPAAK